MTRSPALDNRVLPGSRTERSFDSAIHLSSLIPALIAAPILARPHLLIGPLLILGPLLLGLPLAGRRYAGRQQRARAIDLAATVGLASIATYALLTVGSRYESVSLLLPIGAILLMLLVINWLLFTIISANRARYGELFDPPWVLKLPKWLRGEPRP